MVDGVGVDVTSLTTGCVGTLVDVGSGVAVGVSVGVGLAVGEATGVSVGVEEGKGVAVAVGTVVAPDMGEGGSNVFTIGDGEGGLMTVATPPRLLFGINEWGDVAARAASRKDRMAMIDNGFRRISTFRL